MYSTSTQSTDSSAIGLTFISPSTYRQMPASSDSSTAISDSLATSTGTLSSPGGAIGTTGPVRRRLVGRAGLPGGVPAFVGVDDVTDQAVPDDVRAGQHGEVHVLDAVEDLADDP